MKIILLITFITISLISLSQIPKSGTYTFNYCDLEYHSCISTCKVVIKGDSITIYATKELAKNRTFTKDGEIIDHGIILKHKSGKWIIGESKKYVDAEGIGVEGPSILDFKKKQYWRF